MVVVLLVVAAVYKGAKWSSPPPDPSHDEPLKQIVKELKRANAQLSKIADVLDKRPPEHGLVCASDGPAVILKFGFDCSKVNEQGETALVVLAQQLRHESRENGYVIVEGYASSVGNASYNLDLSERRAEAVATELKKRLSPHWHQRLIIVSRGERHEEVSLDKEHDVNQKVRVAFCPQ